MRYTPHKILILQYKLEQDGGEFNIHDRNKKCIHRFSRKSHITKVFMK